MEKAFNRPGRLLPVHVPRPDEYSDRSLWSEALVQLLWAQKGTGANGTVQEGPEITQAKLKWGNNISTKASKTPVAEGTAIIPYNSNIHKNKSLISNSTSINNKISTHFS